MTTSPVVSITDELIAELEAAANAATPQDLDSAEEITKADPGAMIECPVCCGEGYASIENDYCNFDNHAIGVQFYGIGPEFGAGERYFRAANPATILALLAERADLKQQLAAASVDAERYQKLRTVTPYRFRKIQDGALTDGGDCLYFHSDRFDAAIDAARDIAAMDIGSGD